MGEDGEVDRVGGVGRGVNREEEEGGGRVYLGGGRETIDHNVILGWEGREGQFLVIIWNIHVIETHSCIIHSSCGGGSHSCVPVLGHDETGGLQGVDLSGVCCEFVCLTVCLSVSVSTSNRSCFLVF